MIVGNIIFGWGVASVYGCRVRWWLFTADGASSYAEATVDRRVAVEPSLRVKPLGRCRSDLIYTGIVSQTFTFLGVGSGGSFSGCRRCRGRRAICCGEWLVWRLGCVGIWLRCLGLTDRGCRLCRVPFPGGVRSGGLCRSRMSGAPRWRC